MTKRSRSAGRALSWLLGLGVIFSLAAAGMFLRETGATGVESQGPKWDTDGNARPRESPVLLQESEHPSPREVRERRYAFQEPQQRPLAKAEAIRSAHRGEKMADRPDSPAIARAMDRLQGQPTPVNEIFALVSVTDRNTGERRYFTRGHPDLEVARAVADPDLEPDGVSYEESDSAWADPEIEVAVRSIIAHAVGPRNPDTPSRFEEEEHKLRLRNANRGMSHRIEEGLRTRIESGRIDLRSDQSVPVVISLREVPVLKLPKANDLAPAGLLYVGLDIAAARERALIDRMQMMQARQAPLLRVIEASGGTVRYASWMSGQVHADLPAHALRELTGQASVFSIEFEEPLVEHNHRFQGNDYYIATDAQDFDPDHAGVHGIYSKHTFTSRIVMALGEECIDLGNPAWLTAGGGWNRGAFLDCDPDLPVCVQGGVEECSGANPHGTIVAQLMVGDFMDGQDPALPGGLLGAIFAARRNLTGTCEECQFIFFQDQNLNERPRVHANACLFGVDIFESSIATQSISCDGNGPYDADVQAMVNCGVHYVQSAGNKGSSGGCTTTHPGDHPWTFTVGGMYTEDPCDTAGEYYTSACPYDPNASRGGANYAGVGTASVIDQTGPYRLHNVLIPLTSNPVQFGAAEGTSLATPIVAGLMARLMDWYRVHVSTSIFYDNRMRNFMLLMGDRSAGSGGTARTTNSHSKWWGSGRVGLVPFDDRPFWSIRRTSRTLAPLEPWVVVDENVNPGATFYKAVVWHNGPDYSLFEPLIQLSVGPQSCSTPIREVLRADNKAMLVFTGSEALNGCSGVVSLIRNFPITGLIGATRRFHFAAYSDTLDERDY